MPASDLVIGVGDLIDRGAQSSEVLKWFRQRPTSSLALLGNHELMALDTIHRLVFLDEPLDLRMLAWLYQGGIETLSNFHLHASFRSNNKGDIKEACLEFVDRGFYDYLKSLPIAIKHEQLLVTHAPALAPQHFLDKMIDHPNLPGVKILEQSALTESELRAFVWNRSNPIYQEKLFQIFGHNSFMGLKRFQSSEGTDFACCIDTSSNLTLTGFCWPSKKIYQMPFSYIEEEIKNIQD